MRFFDVLPALKREAFCSILRKPASDSPDTRDRARAALEYHADWFDLLGLPVTPYYGITVHIGATYGDIEATAERLRAFVESLSDAARARLPVENDDKASLWTFRSWWN